MRTRSNNKRKDSYVSEDDLLKWVRDQNDDLI
jgi:hypothetical protein